MKNKQYRLCVRHVQDVADLPLDSSKPVPGRRIAHGLPADDPVAEFGRGGGHGRGVQQVWGTEQSRGGCVIPARG
ncbi:MAG: hypothetical protein RBR56_05330, partial [Halothiobacillus sp.]|nr:hypothetical protein [Halothiobacillus sp.]